jgi:hypothetical protein
LGLDGRGSSEEAVAVGTLLKGATPGSLVVDVSSVVPPGAANHVAVRGKVSAVCSRHGRHDLRGLAHHWKKQMMID